MRHPTPLLLLFTLIAALAGACTSTPTARTHADSPPPRPALVAVTFRALEDVNPPIRGREMGAFGLVFACDAPPDSPESFVRMLAHAEIVASYRSIREAAAVRDRLAAEHRAAPAWYSARHTDSAWTFTPEEPDWNEGVIRQTAEPIGPADVAISNWGSIHMLPPPLQGRGVGIAMFRTKAYTLHMLTHRDLSASWLLSWQHADELTAGVTNLTLHWHDGDSPRASHWDDRGRFGIPGIATPDNPDRDPLPVPRLW